MKKVLYVAIIAIIAFIAISCASSPKTDKSNPLGIDEANYEKMLSDSIYDEGNNYRVKKVLEKLRAGDDVYIATLGGSITEGAGPSSYKMGYAYRFCDMVKETYTPDKGEHVHFVNAGISGTPSTFGLIRYQDHVINELGHTPDLLILEFAVNDGYENYYVRSYESIVRDALKANDDTAIMLVFSHSEWSNQVAESDIGDWYDLPMTSIRDAITIAMDNGIVTRKQFLADYIHPTKEGHEFMADCLMNLLEIADNSELDTKKETPADPCSSNLFCGLKMIDSDSQENVTIDVGSFKSKDSEMQVFAVAQKSVMPNNFYHAPGAGEESLKLSVNCKALYLVYKTNATWNNILFGSAEVYIDGTLVNTYDGVSKDGWNNPVTVILLDEETAKDHIIEVKMKEGDEKKAFTICAFGYAQ